MKIDLRIITKFNTGEKENMNSPHKPETVAIRKMKFNLDLTKVTVKPIVNDFLST